MLLTTAESWRPHVVVLDLMLPDIPGVEVCRQLRRDGPDNLAILMLTASISMFVRVAIFIFILTQLHLQHSLHQQLGIIIPHHHRNGHRRHHRDGHHIHPHRHHRRCARSNYR